MLVIAAALTIAFVLSAYTVRIITVDTLPSQAFIASFAQPQVVVTPTCELAQEVSHLLHEAVQQIIDQIDTTLSALDWAQVAEDSLTHSQHGVYVPTGAEFDAAEAQIIAAKVDSTQPAKKVRVYDLARECGVDSKFMRTVLDHQFGIATKSPSSTVTDAQARGVVEFFATHADA